MRSTPDRRIAGPSVYPAPTPSYVLASWRSSARENRTTGIKMVITGATFFTKLRAEK